MSAEVVEDQMDDLREMLREVIETKRQAPPDLHTQVREWLGLIIALGAVGFLVTFGRQVGRIETVVDANREATVSIRHDFNEFVQEMAVAQQQQAKILSTIEARTARLEGIDEGENRRRRRPIAD